MTLLSIKTCYSLSEGIYSLRDLANELKENGINSAAITDTDALFGAPEFEKNCYDVGIKPIIGCTLTEFDNLILLCKNNTGYQNLCKIISETVKTESLLEKYQDGLIAVAAGNFIKDAMLQNRKVAAYAFCVNMNRIFYPDFYIGTECYSKDFDFSVYKELSDLLEIPLCSTNKLLYKKKEQSEILRLLYAVKNNIRLLEVPDFPDIYHLYQKEEIHSFYKNASYILENNDKIAEKCNFVFQRDKLLLPKFGEKDDNEQFFIGSVFKGLYEKYKSVTTEIQKRADYEIDIICKMGFVDYFLIVADYVQYAKSQKIAVGPGRGSGVGSICAYALDITTVDPLRFGLFFERFLNPERVSMPDFDIDFCSEKRHKVIDYVIKKYGADKAAGIAALGTFGVRQAFRDAAKVLSLPAEKAKKITDLLPHFRSSLKQALIERPALSLIYDSDSEIKEVYDAAMKIEGLPRHTTLHAAGIVITPEKITNYAPICTENSMPCVGYTMETVEALGLLKMDFLGLRYLTVLDKTAKSVGVDISKIPDNAPDVFDKIGKGDTDCVFQLESPGMKKTLRKIKPKNIEELSAVIALYRPGPMDSIPKYIQNKNNPKNIFYRHPILKEILKDTFGCIVYQEQVMKTFREIAGYSLGRADVIRRSMSKKKKEILEAEKEKFILGALEKGTSENIATDIWHDMENFASYAFNKSHAVAYAYLAYQTGYLKFRFPRKYEYFIKGNDYENNLLNNLNRKIFIKVLNLENAAKMLGELTRGSLGDINSSRVFLCYNEKVYDSGITVIDPESWIEVFKKFFGDENIK